MKSLPRNLAIKDIINEIASSTGVPKNYLYGSSLADFIFELAGKSSLMEKAFEKSNI